MLRAVLDVSIRRLRRPARSMVWTFLLIGLPGGVALQVLLVATGYVEWRLATDGLPPGAIDTTTVLRAVEAPLLASVPLLALAAGVILFAYRHTVAPLLDLARTADRIAAGTRARVSHVNRVDEIGDLARVLRDWQAATAERDALVERAPVGICQTNSVGRLTHVNLAVQAMLGYGREQLVGRDIIELLHPAARESGRRHRSQVRAGRRSPTTFGGRFARADGSMLRCSVTIAPIDFRDGRPEHHIVILEDVTERARQAEQAAALQRQMLPRSAPALDGYEIAGACLPAQDVSGDLYDWRLTDDGQLDLSVADVMGKGMAAALVMARLRTALRRAPQAGGPAWRVAAGDAAVTFAMEGGEPFVTLFHARLDPATGAFRYVDAGHGHCLVARAGGILARLPGTSPPLGLGLDEPFREATAHLEPGDVLLVHSDGLLERGDEVRDVADLFGEVRPGEDAEGIVRRLMAAVAEERSDDVTVVALRRLGP